jgi:Flp pilus assembly pilin Flp
MQMLSRLWADELGVVVSAELVLVLTILVIGMIVGLTSLRDQVVQELADVGAAVASLNQSYSFSAISGHHSSTAGSEFIDLLDSCDGPDVAGDAALCINICDADSLATPEG